MWGPLDSRPTSAKSLPAALPASGSGLLAWPILCVGSLMVAMIMAVAKTGAQEGCAAEQRAHEGHAADQRARLRTMRQASPGCPSSCVAFFNRC